MCSSDLILILDPATGKTGSEIVITEAERSRDWLFRQGELRQRIYGEIMGGRKND